MTSKPRKTTSPSLLILGPMELVSGDQRVALPRSKKSRALLGYLAVTGRAHRRERLCELFWDVADDPRGALRWTLSRLRSVLPEACLDADRETVALRTDDLVIDARELTMARKASLAEIATEDLERLATLYRGELLEALDLPDFLEFSAWCTAQREELRRAVCDVLAELGNRWREEPARALPIARRRVQLDAFNVQAHQALLGLLVAAGYVEEAERRYEHAARHFREVSAPDSDVLERAWRAVHARGAAPARTTSLRAVVAPAQLGSAPTPFVGRQRYIERFTQLVDAARSAATPHAMLVTGEPGAGKSRLAERLRSIAQDAGFEVRGGRAFDVERNRPFGPWVDALGVDLDELATRGTSGGRDSLFEMFKARVKHAAAERAGMLLVLDDVQWLDRDSAEVLHHVVQTYDGGALVVLLLARGGELADNATVTLVARSLSRDRVLEELELEPLAREEIASVVGEQAVADLERLFEASSGNPLYALELARGAREGHPGPPPTLVQLLRERVSRLPDAAADVLRWAAVLGNTFDAARLEAVMELPQIELVDALEHLERHALLRIDTTRVRERYAFSHDVVREAIYGELSHPRRRLMHRRIALLLGSLPTDAGLAYEISHHASRAGEAVVGVRACTAAGQHALRIFANSDAESLARRGIQLAEELDEPARIEATLELLRVLYTARTPDREEAATRVSALADRALDLGLTRPARMGFQMLSYLRWESSSMADAHDNILQAERVSRAADPEERSQALAQAARCLVLLERNLGQAEAFAFEASGVSKRNGRSSAAVSFALAMIAAHRGERDAAEGAFDEAQHLARTSGERLAEFNALEHRLMLAIDRGAHSDAASLASRLVDLGARVRPGAEKQIAAALHALAELLGGADQPAQLEQAVAALRQADAKYELAFVLTRWALHLLANDRLDDATRIANDAVEVAAAIGRSSERALATVVLADVALRRSDRDACARYVAQLPEGAADLSATARAVLDEFQRRHAS